jgi:hypothetical protein
MDHCDTHPWDAVESHAIREQERLRFAARDLDGTQQPGFDARDSGLDLRCARGWELATRRVAGAQGQAETDDTWRESW